MRRGSPRAPGPQGCPASPVGKGQHGAGWTLCLTPGGPVSLSSCWDRSPPGCAALVLSRGNPLLLETDSDQEASPFPQPLLLWALWLGWASAMGCTWDSAPRTASTWWSRVRGVWARARVGGSYLCLTDVCVGFSARFLLSHWTVTCRDNPSPLNTSACAS